MKLYISMKLSKRIGIGAFVAFSLIFILSESRSQQFIDGQSLTIVGKLMDTPEPFHRIDTLLYPDLPAEVKQRGTASAGLAISFKSNSGSIVAQWCTDRINASPNMTAIGYRGLDLYIKKNGTWQFAGVGRPKQGESCSTDLLVQNLDREEKEFLLYLPLYSETKSIQIGIDPGSSISAGEQPFRKTVVVYGSSIVQGASASRPGLAYPALLSRQTGINFINMGMSGVAKMEKAVVDMLADYKADAYLLDCIPNSSPEQVSERTGYLLSTLRENHPQAPIVLMQSLIREHGYFNQEVGKRNLQQNQNAHLEFLKVQQNGIENLHFISAEDLLGSDHEGTVDGTHPNDLGYERMIQEIRPVILSLFEKK